ncbi:hypothetical protein NAPIS_ORF00567 [Vairimorpha apis BRL 01]|uniref:Uncharacterized protein n=1 Tax=Vairimorpha apis BRL 01 TaxID=1037528 RepID=T0L2S9_9MICR|nr:hypothetical protein NAPIS_ORF00567 [Vairimorpha apis BRL 01]
MVSYSDYSYKNYKNPTRSDCKRFRYERYNFNLSNNKTESSNHLTNDNEDITKDFCNKIRSNVEYKLNSDVSITKIRKSKNKSVIRSNNYNSNSKNKSNIKSIHNNTFTPTNKSNSNNISNTISSNSNINNKSNHNNKIKTKISKSKANLIKNLFKVKMINNRNKTFFNFNDNQPIDFTKSNFNKITLEKIDDNINEIKLKDNVHGNIIFNDNNLPIKLKDNVHGNIIINDNNLPCTSTSIGNKFGDTRFNIDNERVSGLSNVGCVNDNFSFNCSGMGNSCLDTNVLENGGDSNSILPIHIVSSNATPIYINNSILHQNLLIILKMHLHQNI